MGLILDTSVLIAAERRGGSVKEILQRAWAVHGEDDIAVSAVSVVELTHGIYRARSEVDRERRRAFAQDAFHDLIVHPVTMGIAELAGKIDGEEAAKGIAIAFEDLVIGATALYLGFSVATRNVKHFRLIPGLQIITL